MKTAIVTGASFGIGRAIATLLSESGFNVIAVARSRDEIKGLSDEHKHISSYVLDITDEIEVSKFIDSLGDIEIDLLVNNAGGGATNQKVHNDILEKWRQAYEINVVAAVNLSRLVIPNMIKNKDGHIIFITSTCGHFVYPGGSGYTVSKHAEVALAELLRMELIGTGIRVTEIAPGNVNSRGDGDANNSLSPNDVAEAVKWSALMPKHVNIESIKMLHINNSIR
jgi:NADP-dependent 3-hydroxy acid dehydrogenase YdfG